MESKIDYSEYIKSNSPLKDSILWNKSFPDIKNFTQKYKKEDVIPDNINIKLIVSEYFKQLNNLLDKKVQDTLQLLKIPKKSLSKEYLHYYKDDNEYYKDIDKHLSDIMGNNFENLVPKVRLHIDVFCYLFSVIEKEFVNKHFVDYDLNIIYWAILFHDIGKFIKMHPIYELKITLKKKVDRMHPYKSAIIFLDTIIEKKLVNLNQKDLDIFCQNFTKFKQTIYDSYLVRDKKQKSFSINIKYFDEIILYIKYLRSLGKENNWFCDVLILIIFHQNLPNNEFHMNKELLTKEQIMDVFDLRLLEMMRIIMVLDSFSHTVFDPSEWTAQINMNLDKVREYFIQDNK